MANKLLHKSSSVAGKTPASADLNLREIAVNTADGLAFMKTGAGQIITINPPAQATYNSNTAYSGTSMVSYTGTGTTDSNGRVVFNITKDGTASGTAIFSSVFVRMAQGYSTSTTSTNAAPYCVIEAYTAKTVTVRCLMGVTLLLLSNTTAYAAAGYKVDLFVTGAL